VSTNDAICNGNFIESRIHSCKNLSYTEGLFWNFTEYNEHLKNHVHEKKPTLTHTYQYTHTHTHTHTHVCTCIHFMYSISAISTSEYETSQYTSDSTPMDKIIDTTKHLTGNNTSTAYYIHSGPKNMHSKAMKSMALIHTAKQRDPEIHNLQKFRDLQINRILVDCERRYLQEGKTNLKI
jgi:hypothetical protein